LTRIPRTGTRYLPAAPFRKARFRYVYKVYRDKTYRRQNVSATKHIGDKIYRRQNISATKSIGDKTYRRPVWYMDKTYRDNVSGQNVSGQNVSRPNLSATKHIGNKIFQPQNISVTKNVRIRPNFFFFCEDSKLFRLRLRPFVTFLTRSGPIRYRSFYNKNQ
jgi:hypothetical protein